MGVLRNWIGRVFKQTIFYKNTFSSFHSKSMKEGCAVILQYHSVSPLNDSCNSYVGPSLSIMPDSFERQIAFLARRYEVVTLDELMTYIREARKSSRTVVAITFDDGYNDNYRYAYPVLRKYRVPAMFYLTTDCIDGKTFLWTSELRYFVMKSQKSHLSLASLSKKYAIKTVMEKNKAIQDIKRHLINMPRLKREQIICDLRRQSGVKNVDPLKRSMLNWEEVREMRRGGMNFGAHTVSHPSLPYIPMEEARAEILQSKKILETQLNEPIVHFCYPNPGGMLNFTPEIKALVKDAGFESAATSQFGYIGHWDDLFELKRKGVYNKFSKLPDFYFRLEKEAIVEVWSNFLWNRSLSRKFVSRPI